MHCFSRAYCRLRCTGDDFGEGPDWPRRCFIVRLVYHHGGHTDVTALIDSPVTVLSIGSGRPVLSVPVAADRREVGDRLVVQVRWMSSVRSWVFDRVP